MPACAFQLYHDIPQVKSPQTARRFLRFAPAFGDFAGTLS